MKITEISPEEARELIAQDGVLILDARRASDYTFYVTQNGKPVKFQMEYIERGYAGKFEKALCFCWPDRGYKTTAMVLAKMGVKEVFAVRGAPTF
jgi:rhodanese-related sulfurtransferase